MKGVVCLFITVCGAALYAAVATMTNREEGWILWCGFGLLMAAVGLLGCLFFVGEKMGMRDGSAKWEIVRGALTVAVGTLLWSLSRIVPTSEQSYFEGIGVFLACCGPLVAILRLFLHARNRVA